MFAIMFLAVVLQLIASMGTLGSLVAQNLYTNSAAGWYIRLDWTAVYTYAVSIFSILISFSLTVGALARNASGSKRTCSSWFNPFAIFLTSFVLSVLWVVIAGFAYRNPLPMRYPCDVFRHLRGSLEMLGLTSGKSLVEEGGLLVGICQSSKAFQVLAGIGLGLWILILVLSCVAMGTGLNPPSKKSDQSSTSNSRRSLRSLISTMTSLKSEKRRLAGFDTYQQQVPCHSLRPHNPAQKPSLPPPAAAAGTAATETAYNNVKSGKNGCAEARCYYRAGGCFNAGCAHPTCASHQYRPEYGYIRTECKKPQHCKPMCQQHPRPQSRIYTHHRNRHSGVHNIARTPSFASGNSDPDNQCHVIHARQGPKEILDNSAKGAGADRYEPNTALSNIVTGPNNVNTNSAIAETSQTNNIERLDYNSTTDRQLEAGPHGYQQVDEVNSHHYSEEYAGNYSPHHHHHHHHHASHSEHNDSNNDSPQSNQSRRQRLRQLFIRDAEHQD